MIVKGAGVAWSWCCKIACLSERAPSIHDYFLNAILFHFISIWLRVFFFISFFLYNFLCEKSILKNLLKHIFLDLLCQSLNIDSTIDCIHTCMNIEIKKQKGIRNCYRDFWTKVLFVTELRRDGDFSISAAEMGWEFCLIKTILKHFFLE